MSKLLTLTWNIQPREQEQPRTISYFVSLLLYLILLLRHLLDSIPLHHSVNPPPPPLLLLFSTSPSSAFLPASDNVTFCQSAGKHATVAAGSSVAATEIDSNKCGERKRKGGGRARRREREEKKRAKGERKEGRGGGKRKRGTGQLKL